MNLKRIAKQVQPWCIFVVIIAATVNFEFTHFVYGTAVLSVSPVAVLTSVRSSGEDGDDGGDSRVSDPIEYSCKLAFVYVF